MAIAGTASSPQCNRSGLKGKDVGHRNRCLVNMEDSLLIKLDYKWYTYWDLYTVNILGSVHGLVKFVLSLAGTL